MHTTAHTTQPSQRVYCVDLAKAKFQVHTFGPHGERLAQRTYTRAQFKEFFAKAHTARGTVVMEACGSAHHWSRQLRQRSHATELLPAQFVNKARHGNKTDGNDADAIYAVYCDRRVRPVPVKTLEQQDLCAQHRVRELLIGQQTQCINQIRGLLAERGMVGGKGDAGFKALIQRVHAAADGQDDTGEITPLLHHSVALALEHLDQVRTHIKAMDRQLKEAFKASAVATQVETIFGVGLITATAVAGEIGPQVERFADARQFAASLGLTPKESSSGQTRRLGFITQRGDPYLRRLLVQGAHAVLVRCRRRDDALCLFARRLLDAGKLDAKVAVAVANRLARIIYAVIKHNRPYHPAGRRADPAAA